MDNINRNPKTLDRWREILTQEEIEALKNYHHTDPMEVLEPSEVLEIVVAWEGGLASAYTIKSVIKRIYGIEL